MARGGGPNTGEVEAAARSSAKVAALQDGQRPSAGRAPPQWGQLKSARSLAKPRRYWPGAGRPERTSPLAGRQWMYEGGGGAGCALDQATSRTRTDVPTWIWSPGARKASSTAWPLTYT